MFLRIGRRLILATFLLVVSVPMTQAVAAAESSAGLKVGGTAPDFQAKALDGKTINLYDLASQKKLVLLSFWGLRCGACIEEIPSLNAAQKKWADEGLQVVGINVDGIEAEIIRRQLPMLGNRPEYMLVADPELKISDGYKLEAAPLTVGVSPKREVVFIHTGFQEGDEKVLFEFLSAFLSSGGRAKETGK